MPNAAAAHIFSCEVNVVRSGVSRDTSVPPILRILDVWETARSSRPCSELRRALQKRRYPYPTESYTSRTCNLTIYILMKSLDYTTHKVSQLDRTCVLSVAHLR